MEGVGKEWGGVKEKWGGVGGVGRSGLIGKKGGGWGVGSIAKVW